MENEEIAKHNPQMEIVDPLQDSIGCLLVIAFPKSSSRNYPLAVSVAEAAERYAVIAIGGKPMHVAAFGKTQADAGKALALLEYTHGWKGKLIFSRGRMIQNSYEVSQIVRCFLEACLCRDRKAHCYQIIDEPFSVVQDMRMSISITLVEKPPIKQEIQVDRYAFPCKFLFPWFKFQEGHPSSWQDQIQAAGVRRGCDVCPHFVADDFKKVGTRTVLKDFPSEAIS
jgi:hypothetical protein